MTDSRFQKLLSFVETELKKAKVSSNVKLVSLGGDASFRKYYRIENLNLIAVDSPPDTQKNTEFVEIDRALSLSNVIVPKILSVDYEQGFLIIQDLGNETFDKKAVGVNQKEFYKKAVDLLPLIAKTEFKRNFQLKDFSKDFINTELNIFNEWMLEKYLNVTLSDSEKQDLDDAYKLLIENCLNQKQVCMHRDYHCRNLMVVPFNELAVIDFQDMVKGPITYDLASILYDCYINLDKGLIEELTKRAFEAFTRNNLIDNLSFDEFKQQLVMTSLQRHIKVLGIFCRLSKRDGKHGYLKDLPRVINYVIDECSISPKFDKLKQIIQKYVVGKF